MGPRRQLIPLSAALLGALLAPLAGCTSYTSVPGPESPLAGDNPNARQAARATEAALQWVIQRHPVQGPFVLNLPAGTSLETAEAIAQAVGPMAQLPDEATGDLPVYHVSRVWIRLSDAKVDVVFPSTDGLGRPVQRGVTAWMNAGVRPWRVSRGQYWSPGTVPVPPLWTPIPQAELDATAQAEKAAREQAERDARAAQTQTQTQTQPQPEAAPEPDAPEPAVELDGSEPAQGDGA